MPDKLEIFRCKFCGMEYGKEGEAENCERSHLHVSDMGLGRVEKPANDDFCYIPQSRWPTFIYIKCVTKAIDGAYYQLVIPGTRRKEPGGKTDEFGGL